MSYLWNFRALIILPNTSSLPSATTAMKLLSVFLLSSLILLAAGSYDGNDTSWAVLNDLDDASFFLQAVEAVQATVSANFTGTILAPSNKAFANMLQLMNATAEELLDQKAIVAALVMYHVAPGYAKNLSANSTLPVALLNKTLGVSRRNATFYINGDYNSAKVLSTIYETTSKGALSKVIHIIDRVLIPDIPTTTNATTARNLTISRFKAANITVAQKAALLAPNATNLTLGNTTFFTRNASSRGSPFNSTQWRDPDFIMAMAENRTGRQLGGGARRRSLVGTAAGARTGGGGAAPPLPLVAGVVVGVVAVMALLVASAVMGGAGKSSTGGDERRWLLDV